LAQGAAEPTLGQTGWLATPAYFFIFFLNKIRDGGILEKKKEKEKRSHNGRIAII
jgi:hypothetical protein